MLRIFIVICLVATINNVHTRDPEPELYTINTDGCKIPAYPLVTDAIRELVSPPDNMSPNCSSAHMPLLASNATHIWIIKQSYEFFNIFSELEFSCCYRNFSAQGNVENIAYGTCLEFSNAIKGKHEFARVECYNGGTKIYEDIFKFNVYKVMRRTRKRRDDSSFNVLMLGIDSMSRKNFLRTMSQTSTFLKMRGSIQMNGYNKLGDNSFPNLFPMLTGKPFKEARKECWKNNVFNNDACTFMWDMYKTAGYHTAMGADSGAGVLGVYESYLPYKPTDFYMQPFMYETRHLYKDRTYDYHLCLNNRFMYKELLNFVQDVVTTVHRGKLFGFFWEESVSHSHLNYPYIMDNDYHNLLVSLEKSKYLDNTIVIVFSDHGTRWGKILDTDLGRQESRLPLFDILLPRKFRRRYNIAYKNLELNSHRLTTAHDVYETLLDLLNIKSLDDSKMINERMRSFNTNARGISLFLPIPTNRTCETVGINKHWCTCMTGDKVEVGEKGKQFIGKYLLNHLNQVLAEYPQCRSLKLDRILDVAAMKALKDHSTTYRVVLQTNPGGGIFEGTLVRDRTLWTVSGIVSRLNEYGDQSRCVKDPLAKMYCYCRNNR